MKTIAKILVFNGAKVLCSDPFVQDPEFVAEEDLLEKSDIVIIGAPHSSYKTLDLAKKHVIDIWG